MKNENKIEKMKIEKYNGKIEIRKKSIKKYKLKKCFSQDQKKLAMNFIIVGQ